MVQSVFGIWDYIIMAATTIASVVIGLYFRFSGGKQKTNEEYLLADRNMSTLPVAVSLMASFMSAITLLGVSAENYYYGMQFIVINISYGIATPIASRLYLPVFFGLQKTSTYEYLELRFGSHIRMLASLTYTLQMVLYNGIVLYAPAIVLEAVTGLDRLISILVVGLACTFYSTLGGMKAVLFTDLLQSVLMFAAVISVVIFASIQVGGIDKIFMIAQERGRLDFSKTQDINPVYSIIMSAVSAIAGNGFFSHGERFLIRHHACPRRVDNLRRLSPVSITMFYFTIDPTERTTWWSTTIGGLITYLSLYAVNHTQVQRLLTVKTLEQSQKCLWWSWPVLSALSFITCFSGIGMYAVYKDCDPLTTRQITAIDQLMPFYVVNAMKSVPGLAGLFVAGIFSASLSTISASCNALAAVTLTDYAGRWFKLNPAIIPWLTKLAACGYGVVFLALAFLAEHLGGVLQAALTIFGAVGGPLFGVFTLGMFTTYANELGTSVGLISSMALTLWISFGGPRPVPAKLPLSTLDCGFNVTQLVQPTSAVNPSDYFYLYRISYLWTSPIGFVWVLAIGSAVSLLFQHQQPWEREGRTHPDPALFTPPLAKRLRAKFEEKPSIQCKLLNSKEEGC